MRLLLLWEAFESFKSEKTVVLLHKTSQAEISILYDEAVTFDCFEAAVVPKKAKEQKSIHNFKIH